MRGGRPSACNPLAEHKRIYAGAKQTLQPRRYYYGVAQARLCKERFDNSNSQESAYPPLKPPLPATGPTMQSQGCAMNS